MNKIPIDCGGKLNLSIVGKELHSGHAFMVRTNARSKNIDYLVFFDSRGISAQYYGSLAEKLIKKINACGKTFLLICRPLEMTTWSSLISFLENSEILPSKIVTNVGFVDFTPKKKETLALSIDHVNAVLGAKIATAKFAEYYHTSEGIKPLYNTQYKQKYLSNVELVCKTNDVVVINTPKVHQNFSGIKQRPLSFFSGILKANEFNRSISGAKIIEVPEFDNKLTYDAVHFTSEGNELIFDLVKEAL